MSKSVCLCFPPRFLVSGLTFRTLYSNLKLYSFYILLTWLVSVFLRILLLYPWKILVCSFLYHLCQVFGIMLMLVYLFAKTAITKNHRLGGLDNRNIFLTLLEAGNSKIKVPSGLVSDMDSLSGLQMADFSPLCAHTTFPLSLCGERARALMSLNLWVLGRTQFSPLHYPRLKHMSR